VEDLVKQPVPLLNAEFKLPNASGAKYGASKDESAADKMHQAHAEFLQPIVAELSALETKAQRNFWSLQTRWSK